MIRTNGMDDAIKKARFEIAARFKELGIKDEREMVAYISRNANVRTDKRPTLNDLLSLLHKMERELKSLQQVTTWGPVHEIH
ncbi:hypothetical protein FOI68_03575 [Brevibacillus sp. LEMMJ03]|jgi:hypothetical protein|uniref:hypothetical protein n=1 Tax=Brevibacillus sp. LEMMJ03 TaxID=2595056 RepID=UPI001180CA81|nr:hypothetical protein [Brevibacillus sp. LEMMJ03]TRY27448.1 hypothetical protein FOI68_03575 [Brevibacillus sp. LEMMJ03]